MPERPIRWVTMLGPDGAGKTTVIAELSKRLADRGASVALFHWRPGMLRGRAVHNDEPVTDPHKSPVRNPVVSAGKLLFLFCDWWLGYLLLIRRELAAGKTVIFDRGFVDLLVDPRRYRYGGPAWLAEAVGYLLPRPGLVVLLDAPVDVLRGRKVEVPLTETIRQRRAYLERVERLPNGVVVDASHPIAEVARHVELEICPRREGASA